MQQYIHPEGTGDHYSTWQLISDLARYIKPYRWYFIIGSLFRVLGDLSNLYPAFALAYTINFATKYTSEQSLRQLWIVIGIWALLYCARNFFIFLSKYFVFYVAEKVSIDSQIVALEHLIKLDMSWQEKENSGNKLKRITNGGYGLLRVTKIWVNNIIEITVNLIGMTIIIFNFDAIISLVIIAFLVTHYIISHITIKAGGRAAYQVNIREESVNGLFFEIVNNVRTVKAMSIHTGIIAILQTEITDLMHRIKTRIIKFQSRVSLLGIWGSLFRLVCVVIAVIGVLNGRYEVGFIILFVGYFDRIWESIRELSDVSQDIVISRQSVSRMNDLLNEPVTVDSENMKKSFPGDWQTIRLENVTFSYGSNNVLNNISFSIKRGEKVGIVGLSGAGKSTLFKLLLKENETYTGTIYIDEVPLTTISKQDYLKFISVVFQETEVFNFSLKDNITLVNPKQSQNNELLTQAMDIAHVTDFVSKLPNGIDTTIGEKGVKLSGGEKQRLGIARAIFKQPEILLLDEATSHLDLESEEKIRDSLNHFFKNVTAVVIAHRLTTIKAMDRILVIEEGSIIESGSFEELYEKHGRFYELWEKQRL